MASRRKPTARYLIHRQSGRARAVWSTQAGVRKEKLLPGVYDSKESRSAYARLLLELEAAPHGVKDQRSLTVAELLLGYLVHAEQHYRGADGELTDEVRHLKAAVRGVRELYGEAFVTEFGPLSLKAVRQQFITKGWGRKTINSRVERVRRVFKWGVAEELVPAPIYQALLSVEGLKRGRTSARESNPIEPVEDAVVDATLPFLNRHVRGLVEFQRLSGCRPGEACRLRRSDIDSGENVWIFRPAQHKGAWRGKARVIAIGPKAQAVIREFFTPSIDDYLFSPRRAVEELNAARSANRTTPRYPSHMKRNEDKRSGQKRKRPPSDQYSRLAYATAIDRACDRAFPPLGDLKRRESETRDVWWGRLSEHERTRVKVWRKAHKWHPNQLRHSFATRVRKAHGLEAAQVLLGHARADVTQVYAERNEELATAVAAIIG